MMLSFMALWNFVFSRKIHHFPLVSLYGSHIFYNLFLSGSYFFAIKKTLIEKRLMDNF